MYDDFLCIFLKKKSDYVSEIQNDCFLHFVFTCHGIWSWLVLTEHERQARVLKELNHSLEMESLSEKSLFSTTLANGKPLRGKTQKIKIK